MHAREGRREWRRDGYGNGHERRSETGRRIGERWDVAGGGKCRKQRENVRAERKCGGKKENV